MSQKPRLEHLIEGRECEYVMAGCWLPAIRTVVVTRRFVVIIMTAWFIVELLVEEMMLLFLGDVRLRVVGLFLSELLC